MFHGYKTHTHTHVHPERVREENEGERRRFSFWDLHIPVSSLALCTAGPLIYLSLLSQTWERSPQL